LRSGGRQSLIVLVIAVLFSNARTRRGEPVIT
jgi:hypothetical protein